MKNFLIPIIIILFGVSWLLAEYNLVDVSQTLWTGGLFISGCALLMAKGFNKESFVPGSFLLICAIFSILRAANLITIEKEMPILVIIIGVLLIFNRTALIPHRQTENKS